MTMTTMRRLGIARGRGRRFIKMREWRMLRRCLPRRRRRRRRMLRCLLEDEEEEEEEEEEVDY